MKHTTILTALCMTALLMSCSYEDDILIKDADQSPAISTQDTVSFRDTSGIFEILNLAYPGLEEVKSAVEAGDTLAAAKALLEYWRYGRTAVNPYIALINTTISDTDLRIADQACEHRFYVKGFAEKEEDGVATYYLFEDKNKNIDWNFTTDKVTDQEFRYQRHRHQWMEPQAKAYRVTGDEKYIKSWIEVYSDWLRTFPCPTGKVYPPAGGAENDIEYEWKGLQVAERVLSQMNIIPYFIYSENFTPQWLCTVLSEFAKAVELMRLNYYADSNILITQSQAVGFAGVMMPEFAKAQEWAEEGFGKLADNASSQFLTDGVHYELDPGYHIAAIADFTEASDLLAANGRTELLPSDFTSKLQNAAHFVMDMVYPDYSLDNWNDTRSASYTKNVLKRNFNTYSEMFPEDGELKWMATEGAEGTKPTHLTKAYSTAGYYMLRNGWDANSTMMILKNCNDPQGGWHNQSDNGTFGLWIKGRNFFPDAGCYAYSGNDRTTWASTRYHNTITVQSKDILPSFRKGELKLLKEGEDGSVTLVTQNTPVFESTEEVTYTHRRAVFFVEKSFFVIVDELYDGGVQSKKKVNLNYHILGSNAVVDDFSKVCQSGMHTEYPDGNNILLHIFTETTQDFAVDPKNTSIDFSDNIGIKSGSRKGLQHTIREPLDGAARFITVIYPFSNAFSDNTVDAIFTDNTEEGSAGTFHAEGAAVKVTVNGKEYNLSYTLN